MEMIFHMILTCFKTYKLSLTSIKKTSNMFQVACLKYVLEHVNHS
jgi:hypothetical protein